MRVFTKTLSALMVLILSSTLVIGQSIFEDDFEAYTSGGQVACQNSEWTTWSAAPCGSEDAYISSLYAHSGVNSAVIAQNNDLVKDFGTAFTSGKYVISMWVYIPTGKAGYFNTLASFAGSTSSWGLEVYFNLSGAGVLNAGGTGAASFTWTENTWFLVENVVDLDADHAEFWLDGNMIYDWQWSLGSNGVAIPNTLDANDFFGATANDQMYIDDYVVEVFAPTFGDPPTDLTAEVSGNDVHLEWNAPGGSTGSILCVDRDGSYDGSYSDEWAIIQAALDANSLTYDYYEVTDISLDGPDLATMLQYDIIIWFSGEAWGYYGNDCMTTNDENNVAQFLDGGGSLFFSGMDYFYASYPTAGNFSSGQFPYDYLGVTSAVQDNWNVFSPDLGNVSGVAGSFAEGIDFQVQDIFTAKDGLYIDKITHMGQNLFNVTNPTPAGIAAVQYSAGNFKSVFTTVAISAVVDPNDLATILGNAIEWFSAKDSGKDLLGYNIYRDGLEIDFTTGTSYDDMDLDEGTYEYFVTAVYDEGESEPSNSVNVSITESGSLFTYDFENYVAGEQLACQTPDEWTTWSNAPCSAVEDAYISTLYAHSGVNSVVVVQNNDLVKDFGTAFTTGKYKISFWVYIPTGKAGYFNTLAEFAGSTSSWGLEVYFNQGGGGSINAGGTGASTFFWNENTWFLVEHVVDLNEDWSEIWMDGNMLYEWQWSLGSNAVPIPNTLDANDFFGATANDQMFFDDYMLEDLSELAAPTDLTLTLSGNDVVLNWDAPSDMIFGKTIPSANQDNYNGPLGLTSPFGPNYLVKGELDCPEGSIFDQSCVGYTTGVTSEVDPGYRVFQYSPISGNVSTITFWGLNLWYNGTGWVACAEDPMAFNIEVYGDNSGVPDLNNQIASYTATIDGFETGEMFAGSYEIMRYSYEIPGGLQFGGGWIMVQGDGSANCWFLWVDSGTPGTLSYQDAGAGPAPTTYVQSLCLAGDQSQNDLGIQEFISPVSGTNLGNAIPVTVVIKNFGTAPQSNFGISYTLDGGTPVNATITSTIAGGGTLQYTFPGTVDLSAFGSYTFVGCTNLAGDENTANDCLTYEVENISTGLLGYKVYHSYQNGAYEVLATVTPTTYTHDSPSLGLHKYYVTALYETGESGPSNTVEVLITEVQEYVSESTTIYPNPVNGIVNIKSEFDILSVRIYNHAGQVVAREMTDTKFYQFNTSDFTPGLYLFQIETNEGVITKRIIVE